MRKTVNKIFAVLLASAVVISGVTCMPKADVQAAGTSDAAVRFVTIEKSEFENHMEAKTYPTYKGEDGNTGWFFAGYFNSESGSVIESKEDSDAVEGKITAKFVSSNYAGITCQVKEGTQNNTKNLRVVSAVHGTNYQAVGFNLYKRTAEGDVLLCKYTADGNNSAQGTTVYKKLRAYKENSTTEYTDSTVAEVFGIPTDSNYEQEFYFTTAVVRGIPNTSDDTAIIIKPYWITMDGSVVEGMGEIDRASDFANEIINVSVNLTTAEEIAAGMLNVEYNADNFALLESDYYDCGRVFDEFEAAEKDGIVKCVGNVSDITKNSENANDVYVNLRFKKTATGGNLSAGQAKFGVTVIDFCNNEEIDKTDAVSAWDIKY